MLSFFGRPSKVAKQGATRKLPVFSFRKLVGDADVKIFGSVSTAVSSVVDLHSIHGDCSAIVDGKPGVKIVVRMTHVAINFTSYYVSVDALVGRIL